MASPDLRIGVLLTHETQLLDISPIDLFGMLDDEYASLMPPGVNKLGKKIEITYIGPGPATGAAFAVQECTAKAGIRTTAVTSSPNVAVGAIDMLFIPGPNPTLPITKDTTDFVRQHAEAGTTILTVCTGCLIAAAAGILEGRSASGPRGLLPKLRKDHPGVKWDDKRRWVKDLPGEKKGGSKAVVWSSGMTLTPAGTPEANNLTCRRYYERARDVRCPDPGAVSWAAVRDGLCLGRCGRQGRAVRHQGQRRYCLVYWSDLESAIPGTQKVRTAK